MAEATHFIDYVRGLKGSVGPAHHWYKDFWAANKTRFPIMWEVARFVLSIPASSISVESLFSVMSSVDADRRGSLTTKRLGAITLVNMIRFVKDRPAPRVISPPTLPTVNVSITFVPGESSARHPMDSEVDDANYLAEVAIDLDWADDVGEADEDAEAVPPAPKRFKPSAAAGGGAGGRDAIDLL